MAIYDFELRISLVTDDVLPELSLRGDVFKLIEAYEFFRSNLNEVSSADGSIKIEKRYIPTPDPY